jgi:tetratricopeptide (TPR) repeat protein
MGLYHDDVVISKGLFEPFITAWAVAGWLLLLVVCGVILRWRGGRWIVLGIAWFLVGHSVESTVLNLELYFEHRNYFPSIGLALMVGGAFAILVKRWPEPKAPLLVSLGLCGLVLAMLASSQVQLWSNRSMLNISHLAGHPNSPRANIDMATELAQLGDLDAAYRYSRVAFENSPQERSGDYEVRNLALSCIAAQPPPPGLIEQIGAKDPQRPLSSVTTLLTLVRMLQDNSCPHIDRIQLADRLAQLYLVDDFKRKAAPKIYSNLAVLENALQRYDNAYAYAEQFLALSPNNTRGLLMKLHFATALGKVDAAQNVIATLQELDEQGRLTVGQQQTLAMYLEK